MTINTTALLSELIAHRGKLRNLVAGKWVETAKYKTLINPLYGTEFLQYPDTQVDELEPFAESLASCPKSGLHNPIRNVERYKMLGRVSFNAAVALSDEGIADYFARLIRSVMPKSYIQAMGEVSVTRAFLENMSPDRVRFLATGQTTPGDRDGQQPQDFYWPYGPVGIISPFNFPLEIPALQLMGALYMGNRPFVKAATTVSIVIEQFLILLHHCGLPLQDVDLLHCRGSVMSAFLEMVKHDVRLVQFTGSSAVAEAISQILHGKVRIEDAGFDWKILGPDYDKKYFEHVAKQCDLDAYAASGQKCSATSILFAHKNWRDVQLFSHLALLASKRRLDDLTIGPVLSWPTWKMLDHVHKLSALPGAYILFGGEELKDHSIPERYGAIRPTAVFVPLQEIEKNFDLVTTEVFGPVQVITEYDDDTLPIVLRLCERMENHLTAAVVTNDQVFANTVLGSTVNGTTYVGMLARTTGAPQNHWFGPCGDPRGAGIGTDQAIRLTWSSPRCIIRDVGPLPSTPLVQS